jgi:tRNA A-37 threonylcarbamoyl transferase component Bud32/TolB-like protein
MAYHPWASQCGDGTFMTDTLDRLRRALGDRYDPDQAIGEGATATVYRARDVKHKRSVAIKVIRPEIARQMDDRRFLQEIEIVARLGHPHILRLFDSGGGEGLLYYVTPFVEGASLEARLRSRGQLPVAEALRLACEIADALSHAHAEGVVHRDIKPANVLLEGGHAVVCDFGIAQARDASASALTATGLAVGTPLYMSPEQTQPGSVVDGRSDVFSLGCVLYEMLAGEPPFQGATPQMLLARKAAMPPTSLSVIRRSVPEEVSAYVARMLAPTSADRPSAESTARALRSFVARHPDEGSRSHRVPAAARVRWRPGKRAWLTLAGLVVAGSMVPRLMASRSSTTTPVSDRVVVGLFANQSGDPSLDFLGDMAIGWITQGLQLARFVDVVPTPTAIYASRYVESNPVKDPLRALAAETRAGIVVSGRYYRTGDTLRFNVEVASAGREGAVLALDPEFGSVADPGAIIDRIRRRVTGALALSLDHQVADAVGSAARPPLYSAYREFTQGMDAYVRNEASAAIPYFRRAYEQDTTFLVSLLFLALNHSNLREWATADSILRVVSLRRSELAPYHVHWLDYRMGIVRGDRPAALTAIRQAADIAPGSKAVYNHANEALENGRPNEAIEALSALEPERGAMRGWLAYWWLLADAYHWVGRSADERRVVQSASQIYASRLVAITLEVRVAAVLGDTTAVYGLLRAAQRSSVEEVGPSLGRGITEAADELHAHGQPQAARRVWLSAVAWFEGLPSERAGNAEARWQYARALYRLDRFDDSRQVAGALAAESPDNVDYRGLLGLIAVRLGNGAAAEEAWKWLENRGDAPYQYGAPQVYQARIAAARGQVGEAVRQVLEAYDHGRHYGLWVHVTPEFDSIRTDPRFFAATAPRDAN